MTRRSDRDRLEEVARHIIDTYRKGRPSYDPGWFATTLPGYDRMIASVHDMLGICLKQEAAELTPRCTFDADHDGDCGWALDRSPQRLARVAPETPGIGLTPIDSAQQ